MNESMPAVYDGIDFIIPGPGVKQTFRLNVAASLS
jgi:hypothetical protein